LSPRLALILFTSFLSAQVAHHAALFFGAHHIHVRASSATGFKRALVAWIMVAGICFGFAALFFRLVVHGGKENQIRSPSRLILGFLYP